MNYNAKYQTDGFVSGIDIIDAEQAAYHRAQMDRAEQQIGNLHYLAKVHTILRSPAELATHPRALDVVEQLIGPDILVYNVTYIIKEPQSPAHVSWHQDLTYWGLDGDEQVSMWLALSTADRTSGCMQMVPGSHRGGRRQHHVNPNDADNVLFQGQTINGVDDSHAVTCALKPGQASFHHGWTVHSSMPNRSEERRIGLNVQYIAPHVRQVKQPGHSALLARGQDRCGHYLPESPAVRNLDPVAIKARERMEILHKQTAATP